MSLESSRDIFLKLDLKNDIRTLTKHSSLKLFWAFHLILSSNVPGGIIIFESILNVLKTSDSGSFKNLLGRTFFEDSF